MEGLVHQRTVERQRLLLRVMTDPLWFAREVLGYDRLTDSYHGPMMEEMWRRDMRRPLLRAALREQVESGVLPAVFLKTAESAGTLYYKDECEEHARDHYKTTMLIARCAKIILLWPEVTIAHWHCVEDKAIECALELGDHFLKNREFRALRPEVMPMTTNRKFCSAQKGFTVVRKVARGEYAKRERHPTFFPKGASAEVTGGHAAIGWLDDIIGQSTINDSQMPVVRRWLGSTVAHVIRTDGGFKWVTGTPWDEDDVYVDMEKNPTDWDVRVRACMETDGKRDYNGTPVLYDMRWIKRKMRDPLCNFPYQMMCDRVPDSERRWPADWDGKCGLEWAMEGNGRVFVLSDPAPMGLSLRGEKDKQRGTTGKDWWSIAVVRLRVREDFQDIILLDGVHSQSWSDAEGYDEACRLLKKWSTSMFFDEDYSGGQLFGAFRAAARRAGVRVHFERDSQGRTRLPQYNESYIKSAKKHRFQKLCNRAELGELWVADSCPSEFLLGNGDTTGALTQASKWIPRKGGESNLKWDDDFDSWSRATDTKLQDFAPHPSVKPEGSTHPWAWWKPEKKEQTWGTRYIRA